MSSSCHQPETNNCFHDDLSSLILNIVQSERLQRTETVKVALSVALSRHFSKCQDGNDGKSCMAFSIATTQALLAGFKESPAIEHYRKCREEATQHPRHCLCDMVRRFLNEMKQAEKPLSLEILCICALPPNIVAAPFLEAPFLEAPFLEEVAKMRRAAERIQRMWRHFLQSRGVYRVTLCRFCYRGCRSGVNCTLAHGQHDIRTNFVRRDENYLRLHYDESLQDFVATLMVSWNQDW
jgi:hypothetical protein